MYVIMTNNLLLKCLWSFLVTHEISSSQDSRRLEDSQEEKIKQPTKKAGPRAGKREATGTWSRRPKPLGDQ
jgi:hypothetical protein